MQDEILDGTRSSLPSSAQKILLLQSTIFGITFYKQQDSILQPTPICRDEILLSMQQKLDNLCEQDNSSVKVASGDEMFKYKAPLSNGTEQEEHCTSDWASSATSIADIQRTEELEDIIHNSSSGKRKKTSTIMSEESCTSQHTSVRSKLTSEPSSHQNRKSATSKISTSLVSQSEQHPTSCTPTPLMSEESCTSQDTSVHSKLTSEPLSYRNRKSATSKVSTFLVSQSEQHPTSRTHIPLIKKSMNQKPNGASSRLKQLSTVGDIRKGRRRVHDGLKDAAPSRRWV
ncbi:hypothetical protein Ancab_000120 [Ancistrocladus abbreviatus]